MFVLSLQLQKKGPKSKWSIYKHASDNTKKCLIVDNLMKSLSVDNILLSVVYRLKEPYIIQNYPDY